VNTKVMFSKATDHWSTPKDVYEALDKEFNFDFDPCPLNGGIDGLSITWGKRNFVKPPYSDIARWVNKAAVEAYYGNLVVMLIPSRTDTRWWHQWVMAAHEIRFIKGRLKFGDAKNSAPFPSCIVIFKPNKQRLLECVEGIMPKLSKFRKALRSAERARTPEYCKELLNETSFR